MKLKYLVCVLFYFNLSMSAQSTADEKININPRDVLPPEIAKMAEYGDYTANLNKGKANISIPLHTITTKNGLEIPISLDYVSNGIKVDELASNVGLGWLLNAGGIITIENESNGGVDDLGGDLKQQIIELAGLDIRTDNIAHHKLYTWLDYMSQTNGDSHPDIYKYNFLGLKGSFIIDSNGDVHGIPTSENKIEIDRTGTVLRGIADVITITDKFGNKFIFKKKLGSSEVSDEQGNSISGSVVTFFVIDKIFLNNKEIVEFEYDFKENGSAKQKNVEFRYDVTPYTNLISQEELVGNNRCPRNIFPVDIKGVAYGTSMNFNIKKIKYGEEEINFIYSDDFRFPILNNTTRKDLNNGLALRKIEVSTNNVVKDNYLLAYDYFKSDGGETDEYYRLKLLNVVKNNLDKHEFQYHESIKLPKRLSFAQDLWGFYNGNIQNTTLLQDLSVNATYNRGAISLRGANRNLGAIQEALAFTLKKIIYPTKGYSEFFFERITQFKSYYKEELVRQVFRVSASQDGNGGTSLDYGYIEKEKTSGFDEMIGSTLRLNFANPCANNVPGPDVISQESNGQVSVSINNLPGLSITKGHDIDISGLLKGKSVKSIKLYLEWQNCLPVATVTWSKPIRTYVEEDEVYGEMRLASIKSFDENHNLAKSVKYEYNKPNTKEAMYSGGSPVLSGIFQIKTIDPSHPVGPGKPMITCNCVVRSDSPLNNYNPDKNGFRYVQEIIEGKGSKEFEFINVGTGGVVNLGDKLPSFKYPGDSYVSKDFWKNGLILSEKSFDENHLLINELINEYEFDTRFNRNSKDYAGGNAISYGIVIGQKIVLNTVTFFSAEAYRYFYYHISSAWVKRIRTIDHKYFSNKLLTTTTEYKYNNFIHLQPTEIESTNSSNDVITQKFYYPDDLNQSLLSDRKGELVKMEIYKNGALLSQINKVFINWGNGLIDIEKIEQAKGTQPLTSEAKVTQRDLANGNVLEVEANGKTTVYLYGYNKKYLVAKIENSTRAIVAQALGMNPTDLLNIDSTKFTQLNNLRNHQLLKDAMISTYEYKPLVGVSKMIDPMGLSTTYEYDATNKLKQVKDHKGNKLSDYEYNFKAL